MHCQHTMPFELIHPNKLRSRSVQLDNVITTSKRTPASPPPAIATRSSSLAHRENERSPPSYRSMLDVETPPKIAPLRAMELDELQREILPLAECQAPLILHWLPATAISHYLWATKQ